MVMVKKKKMMRVRVTMPSYFEELQSLTVNVCLAHMLVFCHSIEMTGAGVPGAAQLISLCYAAPAASAVCAARAGSGRDNL